MTSLFDSRDGAAEYAKVAHNVSQNLASAALNRTPPLGPNSLVLDLACGTGEATSTIIEHARAQGNRIPPTIVGLDISHEMVKLYNERAVSNSWTTVSAKVQDAQNLEGYDDNSFDLVFMGFGIMFLPDSSQCVNEVYRVLKPRGYAVFTTWKEAGVPCLLAQASTTFGIRRTTPTDNNWGTREKLVSAMQRGGFAADKIDVFVEQTQFQRGSGEGIVEALSAPFWNPLCDDTTEAKERWQSSLRRELTPAQKESGSIDMVAWVCIVQKDP